MILYTLYSLMLPLAGQSAASLLTRGATPLTRIHGCWWQGVRVEAARVAAAPRYSGVLCAMSSSVQVNLRSL